MIGGRVGCWIGVGRQQMRAVTATVAAPSSSSSEQICRSASFRSPVSLEMSTSDCLWHSQAAASCFQHAFRARNPDIERLLRTSRDRFDEVDHQPSPAVRISEDLIQRASEVRLAKDSDSVRRTPFGLENAHEARYRRYGPTDRRRKPEW
jgi:hypothetical protein